MKLNNTDVYMYTVWNDSYGNEFETIGDSKKRVHNVTIKNTLISTKLRQKFGIFPKKYKDFIQIKDKINKFINDEQTDLCLQFKFINKYNSQCIDTKYIHHQQFDMNIIHRIHNPPINATLYNHKMYGQDNNSADIQQSFKNIIHYK